MTSYGFRVYGNPTPQGSKVPGVSSKGKLFVREQAGEKLVSWRQAVKEAAKTACEGINTITGPVTLRISFLVPRPASVSEKKRPYPTVAPDLDKLIRGVGDALKEAGVYRDDSQVVCIQATKRYAGSKIDDAAGAWIVISEVPPGGSLPLL